MAEVAAPPTTPPADPVASTAPAAPAADPTSAAPPVSAFDVTKYDPKDVDTWPPEVQKYVRDMRRESEGYRTKATTAETTRQETMDAIAKALGLKPDDDPAKAAETAAQEREAAKAVAKNLAVENAVLRMAAKHGANPEALTDSRSFMRTLEAIDPDSGEFAEQLEQAISKAIESNPTLKVVAAAAPARSGGPVGGGAAIPGQLSRDDLKDMSSDQIVKAKEDGRLNQLLGIK